jgi:hypothetical protein
LRYASGVDAHAAFAHALQAQPTDDALAAVKGLRATAEWRALESSVERALEGSRPAIRLYVQSYRRLTRRVLDAARERYPDRVVETAGRLALVDVRGHPSTAAVAILDEGAVHAPFSPWVNRFGSPDGVVLDLLSRVREALRGLDPLPLPDGASALPHWDVDDAAMLAFVHAVRRELLAADRTPLDTIAETFGLNDTELAKLFGVRRQAVDQWRTDGIPAARQEKVATVAAAADLLARRLKAERVPGIARRPAPGYDGLTMLEMIADDRHRELLDSVRASFDFVRTA